MTNQPLQLSVSAVPVRRVIPPGTPIIQGQSVAPADPISPDQFTVEIAHEPSRSLGKVIADLAFPEHPVIEAQFDHPVVEASLHHIVEADSGWLISDHGHQAAASPDVHLEPMHHEGWHLAD